MARSLIPSDTLNEVVRREVRAYAGEAYGLNGPTKAYYTENPEDRVFCVTAPYIPGRRNNLILMARIVDEQVVIDVDETGKPLRNALLQAGIPAHQIRLAWEPE